MKLFYLLIYLFVLFISVYSVYSSYRTYGQENKISSYNGYTECPPHLTGLFPYLMDCRQFLNCWKGRGGIQSCAPGTLFNPESLECDYPSKVKCSLVYGTIDQSYQIEQPLQKKTTPNKQAHYQHYQQQKQEQHSVHCPYGVSGIYEHPFDCKKFLNCAHGITHVQDCSPGTHFNTLISVCDWPHNVNCGKRKISDDENHKDKEYEEFLNTENGYQQVVLTTRQPRFYGDYEQKQISLSTANNHQEADFSSHNLEFNLQFKRPLNKHNKNIEQHTPTFSNQYPKISKSYASTVTNNQNSFNIHNKNNNPIITSPTPIHSNEWLHESLQLLQSYAKPLPPQSLPNKDSESKSHISKSNITNSLDESLRILNEYNLSRKKNLTKDELIYPIYFRPDTSTNATFTILPTTRVPQIHNTIEYQQKIYNTSSDRREYSKFDNTSSRTEPNPEIDYLPINEAIQLLLRPYKKNHQNYDILTDLGTASKIMENKILNMVNKNGKISNNHSVPLEQKSLAETDFENTSNFADSSEIKLPVVDTAKQLKLLIFKDNDFQNKPSTSFKHSIEWHKLHKIPLPLLTNRSAVIPTHSASSDTANEFSNNNKENVNLSNESELIFSGEQASLNEFDHPETTTQYVPGNVQNNISYQHNHHNHGYFKPIFNDHHNHFHKHNPNLHTDILHNHLEYEHNHHHHCHHPHHEHNRYHHPHHDINHHRFHSMNPILQTTSIPKTTTDSNIENEETTISMTTTLPIPNINDFDYSSTTPTNFPINSGEGKIDVRFNFSQNESCTDRFDCKNGLCISHDKVCDGKNNCRNRFDEQSCDYGYQIRLAGDEQGRSNMGRVEVNVFGRWGYVCDDKFNMIDANVLCKELGFPLGAAEVRGLSYYPPNNVDILNENNQPVFMMDEIDCKGSENSLKDCDFNGWGVHDCNAEEVLGVVCKVSNSNCPVTHWLCEKSEQCIPTSFLCDGIEDCTNGDDENAFYCNASVAYRLADGTEMSGRIEVKYQGIWGTVCDDDFGIAEASVFCRSLGYGGRPTILKNAYGPGVGPIWLDQVSCIGNETSIDKCMHFTWGEHNCNHSEDISVICSPGSDYYPNTEISDYTIDNNYKKHQNQRHSKVLRNDDAEFGRCGRVKVSNDYSAEEIGTYRVISGKTAMKGQHPWQATIRAKGRNGKSLHWCGAVLISQYHLLTVAHCLIGFDKGAYLVRLGDHHSDVDEPSEIEVFIENWVIHDDFRKGQHMNNDIAIITLKSPVEFNSYIQPVCLPSKDAYYFTGMNCTISGWGTIQYGTSTPSLVLKSATVPLISNDVCKQDQIYGKSIMDGMFCAGYIDATHIDACDGDSGGPLVCDNIGSQTLYGLISWGHRCGEANKPGVYVKISHYMDWIQDNVNFPLNVT